MTVAIVVGTTYAIYGFYDYLVPTHRNEIVVSSHALAPFTALVNINAVQRRIGEEINASIIPQLLVPALMNGSVVIVRGVDNHDFPMLSHCMYCCLVGTYLAKRFGIARGSVVILVSLFQRVSVPLKVVGYISKPPYRYEVVVPISVARVLRRASESQASVIYIATASSEARSKLVKILGVSPSERGFIERILVVVESLGKKVEARLYNRLSEAYLSRVGIDRAVITALDVSLSTILSLGLYLFGLSIPNLVRNEITTYRILGVPKRRIFLKLLTVFGLCLAVVGTITYVLVSMGFVRIELMNHVLKLIPDPYTYALSLAISLSFVAMGLRRGLVEE